MKAENYRFKVGVFAEREYKRLVAFYHRILNIENIENLIKLLPLGSIFIFLCSSIRLVVYYKFFNISIVEYIGIQEFLTLFIDDLLFYLSIFGIGILLSLFENIFNISEDFVLKNTTPEWYKNERIFSLILINNYFIVYNIFINLQ